MLKPCRLMFVLVTAWAVGACSGGNGGGNDSGQSANDRNGVNTAPIAATDNMAVVSNAGASLNILGNDYDPDGDTIWLISIDPPTHGTVLIDNGGTTDIASDDSVYYQPETGYQGDDQFSYTISDGRSGRGSGFVNLTIGPPDNPPGPGSAGRPKALLDSRMTTVNTAVSVDVLANDFDPDGGPLSILLVSQPSHGTATINDAGTPGIGTDDFVLYVPDAGYSGYDSFLYRIGDGTQTDYAAVNIVVDGPALSAGVLISGSVFKGPVNDARITLHTLDPAGAPLPNPIAQATTNESGQFSMRLNSHNEHLLVVAESGVFFDETDSSPVIANKRTIQLSDGETLSAILPAAGPYVAVNVYTNALLLKALHDGGVFTNAFDANRQAWQNAFGFDLVGTPPANPVGVDPTAPELSKRYAMTLGGAAAALNTIASRFSRPQMNYAMIRGLIEDLSECRLDGNDFNGPVQVNVGTPQFLPTDMRLNNRILRFRNNHVDQYTGVTLVEVNETVCTILPIPTGDTAAPVLNGLPASLQLNATLVNGIPVSNATIAAFLGAVTALDETDGLLAVSVGLTSGAPLPVNLPLGTSMLRFSATDSSGNTTFADQSITVAANADLSLTATATTLIPAVATTTGFDITVSNSGPQTATGVVINISLGADYDYLGDSSGGAYNPVSGVWTLPSVANGASLSLHIDARVMTGSDYGVSAELLASDLPDTDSVPADGAGDDYVTIMTSPVPLLINTSGATINEGNSGTQTLMMPIGLSHASEVNVSISYTTADMTASAGDDYVATFGTLVVPAGATVAAIPVTVNGDAIVEADEQFSLVLSAPSAGMLGVAVASGNILNDDGLSIRIDDLSILETDAGAASATLTISLNTVSASNTSVDFDTADSTATAADGDYLPVSGTVTIAAGSLSNTFTVIINGDTIAEGDEQFLIQLSDPSQGVIADPVGNVTITNDDDANISIADLSITETDSGLSSAFLTVSVDRAADRDISVNYVTADGTARVSDSDFISTAGTVTLPAGFLSTTFAVGVSGDIKYETDEQFLVSLSNPDFGLLLDADAVVTIGNNDAPPVISIADGSVRERDSGSTLAHLTVSLNTPSGIDVSVDYATADGSATLADNDYFASSGTLTIAAGATTAMASISVAGDTILEPDETVVVSLASPIDATLGSSNATLRIFNDDIFPLASVANATITETDSTQTLNFPVTLSNLSASDVIIDYITVNGTALAGADYSASSGSVTIPAGSSSTVIPVPILGDVIFETDEYFDVELTGVTGGALADTLATGTILNDDSTPELTVNNITVLEGNTTADLGFVIDLSNPSASNITFDYNTVDQSAIAGSDYTAVSGNATIPAGSTSITINVSVLGDTLPEPDETFLFQVTNTVGAIATSPNGAGSLINDDAMPNLSAGNASKFEKNSGLSTLEFRLSLSAAAGVDVTVDYATRDDTATAGSDYVALSGTATIPAGSVMATIDVDIIGDLVLESDETFFVDFTNVSNAILVTPSVRGTIVDEESRGVFVWIGGDPGDPNDWHNPANWAGGTVPRAGDDVAIPLQADQPIVSAAVAPIHDLLMAPAAVLNLSAFNLLVVGELEAGTINSTGTIYFWPGGTAPVSGVLNIAQLRIGRNSRLDGPLSVAGDVSVLDHLEIDGNTMSVSGSLNVSNGHLHMENPADVLDIDGDVVFDTQENSDLSAGTLRVGGNFSQLDDDSEFRPSPAHTTIFDGPDGSTQVINIVSPGTDSDESAFGALVLETNSNIQLTRSTFVTGLLSVPGTFTPRVFRTGGNRRLVLAGGVDVDGLILDNIRMRIKNDPIIRFDNVSFINQPPSVDQLQIRSDNANVVFNQIDFQTMPNTAAGNHLIDARDTDGGTAATVTINNTTPLLLHGLPWSNTDALFELIWGTSTDDSDGDGDDDATEFANGTDPLTANVVDSDGDGIDDATETANGSDPFSPDSDNDGIPDGVELSAGSDPLTPSLANVLYIDPAASLPRDGLSWDTAASDYSNLITLLGGTLPPGIDTANPTFVLIADTSATPIAGLEWQVNLATSCDHIVFQGSLGKAVPAPIDMAGIPVSVFGINAVGERVVSVDNCDNVQFRNIIFAGGNGVNPGGAMRIVNPGSTVLVKDSYFANNSSTRFGGAIATGGGSGGKPLLIVENSSFENNSVSNATGTFLAGGGAIYGGNDTGLRIYSSRFSDNSVNVSGSPVRAGGAGVYLNGVAGAVIADSQFIGNQTANHGAALFIDGNFVASDALVRDSQFNFNSASGSGGAILVSTNASLDIADSTLLANFSDSAANGGGGAIYLAPGSTSLLDSLIVSGNLASDDGGGILVDGAAATISNSIFSVNFASDKGGAISLESTNASAVTHNNLYTANHAGTRGGGVRIWDGTGTVVSNSTFVYNRASGSGGGAWASGSAIVKDSIFWKNRDSDDVLASPPSAGDSLIIATSDFNMLETDASGANDIDLGLLAETPGFEAGFYLIQGVSLGIDSGSTTALAAALDDRTTAIDGAPDLSDVDMGFHYRFDSNGPVANAVLIEPESGNLPASTLNELVVVEIQNAAGVSIGSGQDVWVRLDSAPSGSFLHPLNGIEPLGTDSVVAMDMGDGRYGVAISTGANTGPITLDIWANGSNPGSVILNVL